MMYRLEELLDLGALVLSTIFTSVVLTSIVIGVPLAALIAAVYVFCI